MTGDELKELERRLDTLPDIYPGFTRCTLSSLRANGLGDEVLSFLRETPDATTDLVLVYELLRSGTIETDERQGRGDASGTAAAARSVAASLNANAARKAGTWAEVHPNGLIGTRRGSERW